MRYFIGLAAFVSVCVTTACGGKLDASTGDGTQGTSSVPSSSEIDPIADPPAGPSDGAWGTWQLLSIETSEGRDYDPPFIEIALHPDGKAYRWTCATGGTGDGFRCPFELRRGCMIGTVAVEGLEWRMQIVNKEGSQVIGGATIHEEASGDIAVDGTGVLTPRAHYRRVAAPDAACIPE